MKSPVLFLFHFFISMICAAQPAEKIPTNADDNTLLWEISGNNLSKPSYLFGTFHLMCRHDIKFSKELKQAVSNASEVYFEMDLDDMSNTVGMLSSMYMKDKKTLRDLYSEAEYSRLEKYFTDSLGLSMMFIEKMKPNFAEVFLYTKMLACKNAVGLEEELMKIAKADKKEINGFETAQFQASVFDSIPYEVQAKELLSTIDSIDEYKKNFDEMLTVYKSQKLSGIENLFNKTEFGMNDNRDLLLDSRNKNWVSQLNKILPAKNIFIAVGAGHLVGENGLIALLRKAGYTLRPLMNKN